MSVDIPEIASLDLLNSSYGDDPAIFQMMLEQAQASMPDATLKPGNTEVLLMEAFTPALGVDMTALRMVPASMIEQLLLMYGVVRDPGAPVTGTISINPVPGAGEFTVPAGTVIRYITPDTNETIEMETVGAVVVSGAETFTHVVGTENSTAGNGLPAGTPVEIDGAFQGIMSIALATSLAGGAEPEEDEDLMARGSALFARQTSAVVLPDHFASAVLSRPEVGRALVLNNSNAGAPAEALGHVTVAVADHAGEPLTGQQMSDIHDWLAGQALASLTIHVIAPTYTTSNLTVTAIANSDSYAEDVKFAIEYQLAEWMNPKAWPWVDKVSTFDVAGAAAKALGVAAVTAATTSVTTLNGTAPLARLGTVAVTVTGGMV